MSRATRLTLGTTATLALLLATGPALAATRTVPSAAYPTIQAAVDAANPGDVIRILPGTYVEDVDIATNDLSFLGSCTNPGSVILDGGGNGTGLDFEADEGSVRCLTLRHYSDCIENDGVGLYVNKVRFRNCGIGIEANDTDGFRIIASEFVRCDRTMELEGTDGLVLGVEYRNSGGVYIDGDGLVFRDNSARQIYDDPCLNYEGNEGRIERFTCEDSYDYGVEVYGDDTVVSAVSIRGTPEVGIYAGGDRNIIAGNEVTHTGDYGIEADGDDLQLFDNTVTAAASACYDLSGVDMLVEDNRASYCGDEGFDIRGDKLVVKNNVLLSSQESDGYNIDCRGPEEPEGEECETDVPPLCSFATITGNSAEGTPIDHAGFYVSGENVTMTNNTATSAVSDGFRLDVDDSDIRSNRSSHTGTDGSEGFDVRGDRNSIRYNYATDGGGTGMGVDGDDNMVRGNTCKYNVIDGLVVDGSRNTLRSNVAQVNDGEGIQNDGDDTLLYGNTSTDNRLDCADGGGSIDDASGNVCEDGSDFTDPQEID